MKLASGAIHSKYVSSLLPSPSLSLSLLHSPTFPLSRPLSILSPSLGAFFLLSLPSSFLSSCQLYAKCSSGTKLPAFLYPHPKGSKCGNKRWQRSQLHFNLDSKRLILGYMPIPVAGERVTRPAGPVSYIPVSMAMVGVKGRWKCF